VGQSVEGVEISRGSSGSASGFPQQPSRVDGFRAIGFDGRFVVRLLVCESVEHRRRGDCIRNSSVRICAQFHNTRLDVVGIPRGGMSFALGLFSWCGGNRPLTFGLA